MANLNLSHAHITRLAKLKQKKFRTLEQKVVVEGKRTLQQLSDWGLYPEELYLGDSEPALPAKTVYQVTAEVMKRICDSETPPPVAGLFPLPQERKVTFNSAFYLDGISDPGNMGTIFRIAVAFGVDCVLLSPGCCELGSPKVIRASLGAVYKVPFRMCTIEDLKDSGASVLALDMDGSTALHSFSTPKVPFVIAIGGEAHGLSQELKAIANEVLRIEMPGEMESLNAAVCAGICAFQLCRK